MARRAWFGTPDRWRHVMPCHVSTVHVRLPADLLHLGLPSAGESAVQACGLPAQANGQRDTPPARAVAKQTDDWDDGFGDSDDDFDY